MALTETLQVRLDAELKAYLEARALKEYGEARQIGTLARRIIREDRRAYEALRDETEAAA
jgi:hypothetical protein